MKARDCSLPVYIYGLHEPEDENDMRYVGASVDPWQRYNGHLSESRNYATSPKTLWIASLLKQGKKPGLKILAITDSVHQDQVEAQTADAYFVKGAALVNAFTHLPGIWQCKQVALEAGLHR